jgi:RelA/SpoT family (p)ppGpp synthetase
MVTHALSHAVEDAAAWLEQQAARHGAKKSEILRQALDYLNLHGADSFSDSGAPLTEHAMGCAQQLAAMGFDPETIAAGLLCGLPEAALTTEQLMPRFGAALTHLALGALRLQRMDQMLAETQAAQPPQSEALRQMLLAMTDDIRVVLVKLADRAQALRELAAGDAKTRRKVAHDARELYAPLANRLGVWQLKWELEDLTCRYLEPDIYRQIAHSLDERRLDREWYIEQIIQTLQTELGNAGIDNAAISGRPKHIASIIAKMRKKHLDFDEVYDVRAVRILVNDIKDCFHALGVVHSLWQPIPGQFDDYISRPKGNGYKSLHTAVIGPEHKALEVQIRTHDMHNEAELGVAAHWRYKEGGKGEALQEKITWLRQLLAWKQELNDSAELSQHFRNELFQDEVFVMTPQGKVVALSSGATPLDFAYAVHTELGHRCRGAKVDGSMVSLDTPLKTGQRVEILTVKQGGPSRDWLNPHLGVLKTHRARAKVRQWFRQQDLDSHIQEGRIHLDKELHRLGPEQRQPGKTGDASEIRPQRRDVRRPGTRRCRPEPTGTSAAGRIRACRAEASDRQAQEQGQSVRRVDRRRRQPADPDGALLPPGAAGSHCRLHHPRTRRHHPPRRLRHLAQTARRPSRTSAHRRMGQPRRPGIRRRYRIDRPGSPGAAQGHQRNSFPGKAQRRARQHQFARQPGLHGIHRRSRRHHPAVAIPGTRRTGARHGTRPTQIAGGIVQTDQKRLT